MSTEILFILGLVGLYLYDSAQLRFYNEFFLSYGLRKRFAYNSVMATVHFMKKFLSFPSICFPHRLQFHCQWQLSPQTNQDIQLHQDIENIYALNKILRPLQYSTLLVSICTLIILPLAIFFHMGYLSLTILCVLIYGLNLCNSLYILIQRKKLRLSKKFLAHLLLDTLLCPPFALNSLRKISLQLKLNSDAIHLSHALLAPSQHTVFNQQLSQAIVQLKQQYPISDKHYQALESREIELKK